MSTLKYQANLMSSDSQYNRYLGAGGFRGVDVSDDPSKINETRFANATNMWKDYENQSGIAVETIPGYRKIKSTGKKINGIFRYVYHAGAADEQKFILVHCGDTLRIYKWEDFMNANTETYYDVGKEGITINDEKSNAFQYRNRFFFLCNGYWELIVSESKSETIIIYSFSLKSVSENGYIPKTYIDGEEYEQGNAFSDKVINEYNNFSVPISENPPKFSAPLYNRIKQYEFRSATLNFTHETQKSTSFVDPETGTASPIVLYTSKDYPYYVIKLKSPKACKVILQLTDAETFDKQVQVGGNYELNFTKENEELSVVFSSEMIPTGHVGAFQYSIETTDTSETIPIEVTLYYLDISFNPEFVKYQNEIFTDVHWVGDEDPLATDSKEPHSRVSQTGVFFSAKKQDNIVSGFTTWYRTKAIVGSQTQYTIENFPAGYSLSIEYGIVPTSFNSVGEYTPFSGSHDVSMASAINGCTLFDIFDDRIFLTGNPELPNTIFYANRDNTGYVNPSYFGVLNWFDCGVSNEPIKAMVHNANNLIVMKGNTIQDSVISFYQPWQTQQNIIPKTYIRNDGLPGKGCVGLACNLRDDIVFLSETGLEGIDRQTVNTERAVGHRSSLVDAKLLAEDLTKAMWCEWKDYLVILFPSGNAYMADTRQISSVNGYHQYEWYLLNDIVTWTDDIHAYHYASAFPINSYEAVAYGKCTLNGIEVGKYVTATVNGMERNFCIIDDRADTQLDVDANTAITGSLFSLTDAKGNVWCFTDVPDDANLKNIICVQTGGQIANINAFLLEKQEEMISATFVDSVTTEEKMTSKNMPSFLTEFNGLMIFGTDNGDICVFNTDKRGVRPERLKDEYSEQEYKAQFATTIDAEWYDRCGHAYLSGIETAFDNANVPHLTKNTIKKSCIVEVKLGLTSSFNSQFRTDRDGWSDPSQVSVKNDDFSDNDLFKADFTTNSNATIAVTEKTKKWVVKQYRMYSDKWRTPFGIYGIAYRYSIHGRIKN